MKFDSIDYYHQLLEVLPDAVLVHFNGEIVFANSSMARLFGVENNQQLIGKRILDMVHPDNRGNLRKKAAEMIKNLKGRRCVQEKVIKLDGSVIDVEIAAAFFPYKGKKAVLIAVRDITGSERMRSELALQKAYFQQLFENSPQGIIMVDNDDRIIEANRGFNEIFQYTVEEVKGKFINSIIVPPERITEASAISVNVAEGKIEQRETVRKRKDGSLIDVSILGYPIMIDNEQVGIYGIYTDITDRKQAERALTESEERYRKLVEFLPDAIIVHRDSRIEYSNMAALQLLGSKTEQEIKGFPIMSLFHPDYAETAKTRLEAVLRDKANLPMKEYKIVRLDGTVVDVEIASTWLSYRGEDAVLSVIRDITERKKAQETINNLAYYDTLTGLPNRTLFQECLTLELAHAKRNDTPMAVMFLDLDKFKNVNDSLGHSAGDKLLKMVAGRLQNKVRKTDTVSRMSGDEFILLLSELNRVEDVVNVAQKVLDAFQQPFFVDNNEFYITVSIGISLFPQDGTEVETLVKNADAAMYKAKEVGGNSYQFFTPHINEAIIGRQSLLNRLRKALSNNEFEIHYQPRINLKTGRITGVEALLRWRHPDRGIMLPAEFIPIAEETGIIVPIGEWVLRTACAKNKSWQDQGFVPLRVSVNLSVKQVQMQSLVIIVKSILKETGLEPKYLELEVTENAVAQNMDVTLKVLSQLKDMGVYISIDDFGTGYSCLSRLKRMNVDMLKVGQTFIREVMKDKDDYTIVSTIITMAHNMDMAVTAEGVEKEEQLNILKSLNCDHMQGYLYSKPLTEEEFLRFMDGTGRERVKAHGNS